MSVDEQNKNEILNKRLVTAARTGHYSQVELLLQEDGININVGDKEYAGFTPLHYASDCGNLELVKLLLKNNKVNVNSTNNSGSTPLYVACLQGHVDVVQLLLKNNADVNIHDNSGKTPLHVAIDSTYGNRSGMITLLATYSAEINSRNKYGDTPLHRASQNGQIDDVWMLLSYHADINSTNNNGDTPLHSASMDILNNTCTDTIQYLIDNGAIVNCKNNAGETALHCASRKGFVRIVQVLLQNGFNSKIKNQMEKTPEDVARNEYLRLDRQVEIIECFYQFRLVLRHESYRWFKTKRNNNKQLKCNGCGNGWTIC